ncbi:MAG TPA: DUF4342 domain-containing protein [Candidatus Woesebacteria bacterium]|nr:DUF4342 domain-containing protein [Candidatus Woesebacteria bacterium]
MANTEKTFTETIQVTGEKLVETVKQLLHAGNIRKIQIIDSKGKTVFDFPLTFGVLGALISAPLAILATLIVLAKEYTIRVEREVKK